MLASILEKIRTRNAIVSVIGQGYVGLPLAMEYAKSSFVTYGIDINRYKIDLLKNGESHIGDVDSGTIQSALKSGRYRPTMDFNELKKSDVVVICVPTPLGKTRDPDISYIIEASKEVAKYMSRGKLIILESTTYPGTTREVMLPFFEKNGYKVGKDFFLAFSPERVDPGNDRHTVKNTPKVVGGMTSQCLEAAVGFYSQVIDRVVSVSSVEAAEMTKLLENTFRAVNIGLVNEIATVCHKLNVDSWEVIEAAATKPYGFMPFFPGPGLGGHCIPIDPLYLTWKLKSLNSNCRFIELADEINSKMPDHVVQLVTAALNQRQKAVKGSRLLVLGVAYKKNISDMRESPALGIMERLEVLGAEVDYCDRYVPSFNTPKRERRSTTFDSEKLSIYDCVLIVTNHDDVDYRLVCEKSKLVVDTRNATKAFYADYESKIVRL